MDPTLFSEHSELWFNPLELDSELGLSSSLTRRRTNAPPKIGAQQQ